MYAWRLRVFPIISTLALCFALQVGMISAASAAERILRRTVLSGNSTVVLVLISINERCETLAIPQMEIISAPKHGSTQIIAEERIVTLDKNRRAAKCSGKTAPMSVLYYKSEDNFNGRDEIRIRGIWTQEADLDELRIIISVK